MYTEEPMMRSGFMKQVVLGAAATVALLLAGTAQAALQDRDLDGNGMTDAFYDTDLNITWLRDANVNGDMNWDAAISWADGYSFGGYTDWRLPAWDGCFGVNCTQGEMGHLFYIELGNSAGRGFLANTGGFQNLFSAPYWTSAEYPGFPDYALVFGTAFGDQGGALKTDGWRAMVVRDGDVPAIPEPGTYALMLAGLAALALTRRRPRH